MIHDHDHAIYARKHIHLEVITFVRISHFSSLFFFRIKRGGSRGFVLNDDSLDEGFFIESSNQGQTWLEKYQNKFANG